MRTRVENYYMSIAPVLAMEQRGIITHRDFLKIEEFLAEKYYLKKHNIYRLNDLINIEKRAIYMIPQKEANNDTKNDNDNRSITEIRKAD